MIIGSLNVRGLGGRIKKKEVREIIYSNHLDFIAIQETKLQVVDEGLCHYLWGNPFCEWSFILVVGNSGGILSIWSCEKGESIFSFVGPSFIGTCFEWGVSSVQCFVVNVYSKCALSDKRIMWDKLINFKLAFGGEAWCVVGDFNPAVHVVPAQWGCYEYVRPVLSVGWVVGALGGRNPMALPRDISDHCPIILRYSSQLWGPKPFRFNNFWLNHHGFSEAVKKNWVCPAPQNWMAFKLKEKLIALKPNLKIWNKEVFGILDRRIELISEAICELDLKAGSSILLPVEIEARHKALADLWGLLKCKESQLFQRSKSRWLKEGDVNTKYFHASVKSRGRKNVILARNVGGRWVESVADVRSEIVDYFSTHFSETMEDRPTLDGIVFQGLSSQKMGILTAPFNEAEIKKVVVSSDGNNSPRPDGFNFLFFKSFWDLLKDKVGIMFDQLFGTANLPRNLSSYFITLIPKIEAPPFIKGRQLVDGVVAVNEWRSWIRACVFTGTLAVLVNGCLNEEINIQRGRAKEICMFKGFKVGINGLSVSHLQYAYDTIFLGEASIENLWTLKTILRCFEMASGLKVNYAKSSVMGVTVSSDFLNLAERFLHCSIGSIPFTYLGLLVGANPRKESTWKHLLMALSSKLGVWRNRYGTIFPSPHLGGRPNCFSRVSSWWKDVSHLGGRTVARSDWFSERVIRKVSNGNLTAFWFDPWVGDLSIKDRYHMLFQVSEQCLELVGNMGLWEHGQWLWDFRWRRELSVAEFELLRNLLQVVSQSSLLRMEDSWVWTMDPTGSYSGKSAYLAITGVEATHEPNSLLARVWKSWAPSKVLVFSWQLLQDRVPTKQNLLRRRIFMEAFQSLCALCGDVVESVDHLFITYDCIFIFWYNLARWLGFELVSPNSISSLFEGFLGLGVSRKSSGRFNQSCAGADRGWCRIWVLASVDSTRWVV
ncbi:hypothetical protein TSUD_368280 [Trifolium subterraneum]|uniref:Reverse transcriptase zinc-binding domain-containing protein n=1 Tax=Trifolium subterraneum TaxID=3900 RepID=A0A2Z6M4H9_TRISU|nr:hypothetical protein TSUD_368280 [Trifolium subterraneum]